MSATDILREDHRLAWRLEAVIVSCADGLESGSDIPPEDVMRISDTIDGFLDSLHHAREEDTYFPCVGAYGMADEIRKFLIEHEFGRRIASKIARHTALWKSGKGEREPVVRFLRTYAIFLRDHMTKEERFFDDAQRALSEQEEAEMREYFMSVSMAAKTARAADAEVAALEDSAWFKSSLKTRPEA